MKIFETYLRWAGYQPNDPAPLLGDYAYRAALAGVGYLVGIVLALTIATGAWAADAPHHNHPQDLPLHEAFYQHWKMPQTRDPASGKRTASCCSKEDCYPTTIKPIGKWFYALRREDGRWVQIPDSHLEQAYMDPRTSPGDGLESPDGQSHVCMSKPAWGYDGYSYGEDEKPAHREPVDPAAMQIGNDSTVYCATIGSGL